MSDGFAARLRRAFDNASMAEIARRIEVPHATIRNYFVSGRLPAPEVLMKIAKATNISLNWLLLGTGEVYAGARRDIDLGRLFAEKINEIIDRKLGAGAGIQDLGTVDESAEFNIENAVRKFDDPQRVISEWFRFEGRDDPGDYGVIFFQGWESYSDTEKIEAVRDAKKVLDRTLKKQ
jgi:transcriptional regulator with XRE-family HTH domain